MSLSTWRLHVPNALTGSRLLLGLVFFAMLSYYQYDPPGSPWLLHSAFLVYMVALITDFLDGYLARRWKAEGKFGRMVDPFVDKVLVLGSFVFFAGKNFIIPQAHNPADLPANVRTITGVVPWMVVLILARELLITGIRGSSESSGKNFGAQFSGKLKMVFQSCTILVILLYVNYLPQLQAHGLEPGARCFRDFCIWGTLVITVVSGALYLKRAIGMYRQKQSQSVSS